MNVGRVTNVMNPKTRPRHRPRASGSPSSRNPVHLLHLGWTVNPKRRKPVAVKAKKKSKNRSHTHRRPPQRPSAHNRRRGKGNPGTRVVVIAPKSKNVRRNGRKNPTFFGQSVSVAKMGEYIAGGLIGVTINRVVLPLLPAQVTSNNIFATVAAFALALAEWWAASWIDKDFGASVGFGALMNAGSQALNAFIPQVGSVISLSGRRGVSDFVPGLFTVPQNPILDANSGLSIGGGVMNNAYPAAYGRAA